MQIKQKAYQALAIGLLALFTGVEFFSLFSLDALSPYAMYGFEAIFAVFIALFYRKMEWKKESVSFGFAVTVFFALVSGFAAFEFTGVLGHTMPFQMKDPETVLLVILFGPVLAECVFRGAVWRLIAELIETPWVSFILTSVLFSYAHYQTIQIAPENIHGFIRYQAIYTLGLGLLCGGMRMHFGLVGSIITHLAFNFGFFVGSV